LPNFHDAFLTAWRKRVSIEQKQTEPSFAL
jgi:hypothetical protein